MAKVLWYTVAAATKADWEDVLDDEYEHLATALDRLAESFPRTASGRGLLQKGSEWRARQLIRGAPQAPTRKGSVCTLSDRLGELPPINEGAAW